MKQTCLKKYGVANPNKLDAIKNKTKQTCLNRYGSEHYITSKDFKGKSEKTIKEKYGDDVVNVFQVKEIQDKAKKTILEKYGSDSVLRLKEFRNIEKAKQTTLEKYGVDNVFKLEQYRNNKKRSKTWENKTREELDLIKQKKVNSWNNKTQDELNEISKKIYETQKKNGTFGYSKSSQTFFWKLYDRLSDSQKNGCYFYELNDEYGVLSYRVDFLVHNKVIEFYGDLWHANPNKFNENDQPKPKDDTTTAKEIWEYDKNRMDMIENKGYDTFVVWEQEAKLNEEQSLINCLNYINN